jgi:hypothetical protein
MPATKSRPAEYIGDMTQLDMVLDARKVLARDGATPAEWAANSMLIARYSNGAWIAEGTAPARRNTDPAVQAPAADADLRPTPDAPMRHGTDAANALAARLATSNAVTPGQRSLVERLARKHHDDATAATIIATLDTLTKRTVSPLIDALIKLDDANPYGRRAAQTRQTAQEQDAKLPTITTGTYRVDGHNYKIENGKGQWTGRVFIREVDNHGDELANIRDAARKMAICTAVAADPTGTMIAYGKATGECGKCHTLLEDPDSVSAGIGPYCEANMRDIPVSQVYAERKARNAERIAAANPPAAPAPAPVVNDTAAPAPAPAAPVIVHCPASLPTDDELTTLSFPALMEIAKQLKVPGRGTARKPQLIDGIRAIRNAA